MAKRRKKSHRRPRRHKPTAPDVQGPRPIVETPAQAAARERAAFEARQKAAIAKAALELDPTDARILEWLLKYPTITQEQIGDVVGLSRQTVNERVNADKFQRALQHATKAALEIFQGNQAAAARKLGALIHSADDRIAVRAAIAHLWPYIHSDKGDATGADFVAFIQEAYELANAKKDEPGSPAAAVPLTEDPPQTA